MRESSFYNKSLLSDIQPKALQSFSHRRHDTKERALVNFYRAQRSQIWSSERNILTSLCSAANSLAGAVFLVKLSRLCPRPELERMTENSESGFSFRSITNKLVAKSCSTASTTHLQREQSLILDPNSYIDHFQFR